MRSRRAVLVAALAVVGIAAVVVTLVLSRSGTGARGPLVPLLNGGLSMGWILHLGESGSISGPLIIRNTSDRQLVLDRVEGVGLLNGGTDMIGAYVLTRPIGIGRVVGFRVPPNGRSLPGAAVRPHSQVELVIGVKATKRGRHGFTALDILYHSGTASYRTAVPLGAAICAPVTLKNCSLPPDAPLGG